MQISVENNQGLERQMTVTLPSSQIEKEVTKRLMQLRKSAKLPGFRPGKIPMNVIQAKYSTDVLHEVASEMINRSCFEALHKEKIEPATQPRIEPKDIKLGEDLEFIATFDVYPEVTKTDLSGESVELPTCVISDSDVDNTIETIRKNHLNWIEVDTPAKKSDQITIDFVGKIQGEEFEGGSAKDYAVVVGEGAMVKDFDDGLIAMKAGEKKSIDVTFPQEYPAKELAGKLVVFEVDAKKVEQSSLPDLDSEFMKKLGIESNELSDLQKQVKENMQRELDSKLETVTKETIFKKISQINEIDLPIQLVEHEADYIRNENLEHLKKQGISDPAMGMEHEKSIEIAQQRVKLSMIIRKVIELNDIKVENKHIEQHLEKLSSQYNDNSAFIDWYRQDKERMQRLESVTLEQLVVERLQNTATLSEKEISFAELMKLN